VSNKDGMILSNIANIDECNIDEDLIMSENINLYKSSIRFVLNIKGIIQFQSIRFSQF